MTVLEIAAAVLLVVASALLLRAVIAADAVLDRSEPAVAEPRASESSPRLGRAA